MLVFVQLHFPFGIPRISFVLSVLTGIFLCHHLIRIVEIVELNQPLHSVSSLSVCILFSAARFFQHVRTLRRNVCVRAEQKKSTYKRIGEKQKISSKQQVNVARAVWQSDACLYSYSYLYTKKIAIATVLLGIFVFLHSFFSLRSFAGVSFANLRSIPQHTVFDRSVCV